MIRRIARIWLAAVTVALVTCWPPLLPASAAPTCDAAAGDDIIPTCTRAIDSGRLHGTALSLAYARRGDAYLEHEKPLLAISDETASIRIHPTADAYEVRGRAYDAAGDLQRAIADLTNAAGLPNAELQVYSYRAAVFYQSGKYARAAADETRLIALETAGAPAFEYYDRALDEDALGRYDLAITDLTQALALKDDPRRGGFITYETHNPNGPPALEDKTFAVAYAARGLAYLHQGKCDEALRDATTAVEADATLAIGYLYRGVAHYCNDDFDATVADETRALNLDPSLAAAYNARGLALFATGNYATAVSDFDNALRVDPKDERARYNRIDAADREAVAGSYNAPPAGPPLAFKSFTLFFAAGSSTMDDEATAIANAAIDYSKEFTNTLPALVMVYGHRDGAEGATQPTISDQRAEAVATYLANGGVPAALIRYRDIRGRGNPKDPYGYRDDEGDGSASGASSDPLARNVRIDVQRTYPGPLPEAPYS